MERWSWTAALVLMAISDPRAVRADALTWSDGTFLNWSSYPYTVYIYDGDPSLFTENVSVGPDNHPEHGDILFHSLGTGGVGEVAVVSVNNAFPYDPSTDGPIDSVRIHYDYRRFYPKEADRQDLETFGFQASLVQDGVLYVTGAHDVPDTSWHDKTRVLTASQFFQVNPYAAGHHPDFTAKGHPMRFGVGSDLHAYSGANAGIEFDNVQVFIYQRPMVPGGRRDTLAVLVALLAAAGAVTVSRPPHSRACRTR